MEHARYSVRKVRVVLIASLLLGAVIVGGLAVTAEEPTITSRESVPVEPYTPEYTAHFPYQVSGIVEATDDVVIRAQTAGVVRSVAVREGDAVSFGEILLATDIPLLSARTALQGAQNEYTHLTHEGSLIGATGSAQKAEVLEGSAHTDAVIATTSSKEEVRSAEALLATELYGSILTLTTALDFIDGNRSYFSERSMRVYRETLGTLYGDTPSYLISGVRYGVDSREDILGILKKHRADGTLDAEILLSFSNSVAGEIAGVNEIFIDGEYDFLDEQVVTQGGDLYESYLATRGALVDAKGSLETAIIALKRAQSGAEDATSGVSTNLALTAIDRASAVSGLQNVEALSAQSGVVGDASLDVLRAEAMLGMPTAPFDGTIAEVFVEAGEYVVPGTPLLRISGAGARELTLTVPAELLPTLQEGGAFVSEGTIVGAVSHFTSVAVDGSITVVVELAGDEPYLVGSTLAGNISLSTTDDELALIPRQYLRFGSDGPFVELEDGRAVGVSIVHDSGAMLYVRGVRPEDGAMLPSRGLRF